MDMLVIAGNVTAPSEQRDAFVAAHQDLIRRVDEEDANPPRSNPKIDTASHV